MRASGTKQSGGPQPGRQACEPTKAWLAGPAEAGLAPAGPGAGRPSGREVGSLELGERDEGLGPEGELPGAELPDRRDVQRLQLLVRPAGRAAAPAPPPRRVEWLQWFSARGFYRHAEFRC